MKILVLTVFIFSSLTVLAANKEAAIEKGKEAAKENPADPNNFFKNRNWVWDIKDYGKIRATSRYIAEPVNTPNLLKIAVSCPGDKDGVYEIVDGYKYCGISSISPAGKILVVHFMDYDDKNQSYCNKPRVERIKLPEVCKTAKAKTAAKDAKKNRKPANK